VPDDRRLHPVDGWNWRPARQPESSRPEPERNLVRVMVHRPEWRGRVMEQITDPAVLREPERRFVSRLSRQFPSHARG